ncbi:MAG: hypothetical protein KAJ75_05680 [Alphaproteobacteria bacterium]|nr:hypothetical protein [Alphaproteobacteria bacterium]
MAKKSPKIVPIIHEDPAVESVKQLLTAMSQLLQAIKSQQEMIALMGNYMDTMSKRMIAISKAIERLEAKP